MPAESKKSPIAASPISSPMRGDQVASIGFVKCTDIFEARRRLNAALDAIRELLLASPEAITGEGEMIFAFGPRGRITVHQDVPGHESKSESKRQLAFGQADYGI